ncbi:alpha/beta fold hydrolase [Spirosoma sp. KUDC1026]|uniref:alpha/beta fold hydrolase n=1 Tax=Spirosoma sp. KUDC1026 TaxID=2745947 RepID=UPI00159BCD0D|nr:alpha/beta hydrolase [Spirosoma sp. KUDC1026]QKZ13497.1 alpha/beta hydrolase [Spirosoma sp. KUDC1026]
MNPFCLFLSLVILCYACSKTDKPNTNATPQTHFIPVADSVKLEVLDWGGSGPPLVFLTGFGNTAHVFTDFAPGFTDQYRVYAITRRGFGQSSKPKTGYDMSTLAHDILVILDSLHIQKALLVGHSIAGDEMSKFASSYPDRVAKLVYLDAAYDRTDIMKQFANAPQQPMPTATDSASLDKLNQYLTEVYAVSIPLEEIQQSFVFSRTGKVLREVAPDYVFGATIPKLQHPDYRHIQCPALALYAGEELFKEGTPLYARLDSTSKTKVAAFRLVDAQFRAQEMNRFRQEVVNGTTSVIEGGNHYVFLSHPAETEKFIRDFLK